MKNIRVLSSGWREVTTNHDETIGTKKAKASRADVKLSTCCLAFGFGEIIGIALLLASCPSAIYQTLVLVEIGLGIVLFERWRSRSKPLAM